MVILSSTNDFSMDEDDLTSVELSTIKKEETEETNSSKVSIRAPENIDKIDERMLKKFVKFLSENYVREIKLMAAKNGESIEIDYMKLMEEFEDILKTESPETIIDNFKEALRQETLEHFPSYHKIKAQLIPRFVNLPVIEELSCLRNVHLNHFVRTVGVVTRRSAVYNLNLLVKYTCVKCQAIIGPFLQTFRSKPEGLLCLDCQSKGPFVVNVAETLYRDFQRITIQENPSAVLPGSIPRSMEVHLFNDLIDSCKPGDEVDVCGVYKNTFSTSMNIKQGFPVFSTIIEGSSVHKIHNQKFVHSGLTKDEEKEVLGISSRPDLLTLLTSSFCPGIYGHEDIKLSLILAMVGGNEKEREGLKIRNNINVLLLGDPGMAKSQFLRYIHKLSHRAVLATGQGSSGVGLTASVRRDPILKEWVLEGGALVLADGGICCIDEFDKMNEHDRTSIHEAMEQQSISIAKAGIVASLHSRCSVIAAANPIKGKYNNQLSFSQNVNLSDPILSRFDLLCVVKDVVDMSEDSRIAKFIIESHSNDLKSHEDGSILSTATLRNYLLFARSNFKPVISKMDVAKISKLYGDLRKESSHSGIPITARHIESIIRIAEAFAKVRLSNYVTGEDVNSALSIVLKSFLSAQKYSVAKQLRRKFSKYFDENSDDLLIYLLKRIFNEKLQMNQSDVSISMKEFEYRCKQNDIRINQNFYRGERFKQEDFVVDGDNITRKIQ